MKTAKSGRQRQPPGRWRFAITHVAHIQEGCDVNRPRCPSKKIAYLILTLSKNMTWNSCKSLQLTQIICSEQDPTQLQEPFFLSRP